MTVDNNPNIHYFPTPKQVLFWDIDGDHYINGIAYRDEIICGCCGGVISIEEIYEFAPSAIRPIIVDDDWYSLENEISVTWAIQNAYTKEEITSLAQEYSEFYNAKKNLEWRGEW